MYVPSPYAVGLLTLWMGYSLGAGDGNFDKFAMWLQCERYPAQGGHRSPLTPDGLVRRAVTGDTSGELTSQEDARAVDLLADLFREFRQATKGD